MSIPMIVTGRDDRVTARHKEHAREKLSKLERFFGGIQKIEVILSHEKETAVAEVVVSVRGGKPLVCHSKDKELYAAIDLVLDKAEGLLNRHKGKLQSRGKPGAPKVAVPEPRDMAAPDGEEERYQDIVEKRDFT